MPQMSRPTASPTQVLSTAVLEKLLRKTPKQLAEFQALSTKVQAGRVSPTERTSFCRQVRDLFPLSFIRERQMALAGHPEILKQAHQWITAAVAKKGTGVTRGEFQTSTVSGGLPSNNSGSSIDQSQTIREGASQSQTSMDTQVPQGSPPVESPPAPGPIPEYMQQPSTAIQPMVYEPPPSRPNYLWWILGAVVLGGGGFFLYRRYGSQS